MNWLLILLAVAQAAVAAALFYRATQLAKQLASTQKRIQCLEDELKAMAESDAVPTIESAQSLTRRMGEIAASASRIQQTPADPAAKLAGDLNGWLEYVPKLVEVFARFAADKRQPESGRKNGGGDES